MYPPVVKISRRSAGVNTSQAARLLETAVNTFAVFFGVVIALISLGYTFLAYPQADDLERTAAMRFLSSLQRIRSDYLNIDGRWASKLTEYSLYRGGHVIDRYPVMLMVLLIIGVIGCCCGIALVSGRRISERSVVAGGIVAYSFLWLSAPRGELFYWFPAGAEDWLPLALSVVLLWLLYNFEAWWSKIIVVAMSLVLPALHEVFGSWIVGVLAVTWLVRIVRAKAGSRTAGAAALAGTLGTASVVLAPGIRARAASTPHESLHDAFKQALQIEAFNLAHWTAMAAVLIVILLAVARTRVRPSWYDEAPLFIKTCLVVAMVPLPILMLTVISYGLGGGIPARVYDGFYFLLAAAAATFAATCGFDLGRWGAAKTLLETQWGSLLRSAVMILAVVGVMSLPRFHAAFHDIDPAIRNRAVWEQRNAEIWAERNAGIRDVVVSERMLPLTILPFYFDMTEDPKWYANQHLAMYYGLQSIRLSYGLGVTGTEIHKYETPVQITSPP